MNKYSGFGGNTSSRFGQEMANRNMEEDEEERMRRLRELFSGRFRTNTPMRKSTGSTGGSSGGGTSGGGTGVDNGGGNSGGGDSGRGGNDRIFT
jgi:hypothetical protein